MKAIILSAGQGTRLLPLTTKRPKCLLPVRGEDTLLDIQLQTLAACGIDEAVIMVGFRADQVTTHLRRLREGGRLPLRTRTVYNPLYDEADNLVTCWMARSEMREPFVLLNGDTVFEATALERLLASPPAPLSLAINRKLHYDADDMKVSLAGTRLCAVSKTLQPGAFDAESIGLMVFRAEGHQIFRRALQDAMRKPDSDKAWYLSVVDAMAKAVRVETVSVTGLRWWEVDCPVDLAEVRRGLAAGNPRATRSAAQRPLEHRRSSLTAELKGGKRCALDS
jgi:choline kinase